MEKQFVENFINSQKQERILFELVKKREKAIDRFSHNAKAILNANRIVLTGEKLQEYDIKKVLYSYIEENVKVYVLSGNNNYDKQIMTLNSAIPLIFNEFLPMIITDGEHFALIKEELSGSYSKKYVLIKQ